MRNILIIGCGDLGSRLGQQLSQQGHAVWGIRRNTARLPKGIQGISADIRQPFAKLDRAIDDVIFCPTPDRRDPEAYTAVFEQGLRHSLTALADQTLRRFIMVSSTSVYGQTDDEWVDEQSITQPRGFNGRALLNSEQYLQDHMANHCIVRFSGIHGPGRGRMIRQVQQGSHYAAANPFSNRIHIDDCVGSLRHLLEQPTLESCYIGSDHQPCRQQVLLTWLAEQLDAPTPQLDPDKPGLASKRCRNQRLQATGYQFTYPDFRQGYLALLAGDSPCA